MCCSVARGRYCGRSSLIGPKSWPPSHSQVCLTSAIYLLRSNPMQSIHSTMDRGDVMALYVRTSNDAAYPITARNFTVYFLRSWHPQRISTRQMQQQTTVETICPKLYQRAPILPLLRLLMFCISLPPSMLPPTMLLSLFLTFLSVVANIMSLQKDVHRWLELGNN